MSSRSSHTLQAVYNRLSSCRPSHFQSLHCPPVFSSTTLRSRRTMSSAHAPSLGGVYDTTHSAVVRKYKRTYGLTPPAVEDYDVQLARCLARLERKQRPIDKYMYLSRLRNCDVVYRSEYEM